MGLSRATVYSALARKPVQLRPREVLDGSETAAIKDATVSQLALAWLLAQGEYVELIFGTRSAKRVDENVAAVDLTLADMDLARIKVVLSHRRIRCTSHREHEVRVGPIRS